VGCENDDDDTCLRTKEPLELETMKTKLRLPSPTSLTDMSEKLLPSFDEREGIDFMYSMSVFSFKGLNSEKLDIVNWFEREFADRIQELIFFSAEFAVLYFWKRDATFYFTLRKM
jgi:hypothetical protein